VQVAVLPVGAAQDDVVSAFAGRCERAGLRVERWHSGSLGARIREAARRKVPFVAVIGEKEAAAGSVSLRLRDPSPQHRDAALPVDDALALLEELSRWPVDEGP
jgi:threonyl-tRNA synthetase